METLNKELGGGEWKRCMGRLRLVLKVEKKFLCGTDGCGCDVESVSIVEVAVRGKRNEGGGRAGVMVSVSIEQLVVVGVSTSLRGLLDRVLDMFVMSM